MGMIFMVFMFECLFRVYSDILIIKGIWLVFLLGIFVIVFRFLKLS